MGSLTVSIPACTKFSMFILFSLSLPLCLSQPLSFSLLALPFSLFLVFSFTPFSLSLMCLFFFLKSSLQSIPWNFFFFFFFYLSFLFPLRLFLCTIFIKKSRTSNLILNRSCCSFLFFVLQLPFSTMVLSRTSASLYETAFSK